MSPRGSDPAPIPTPHAEPTVPVNPRTRSIDLILLALAIALLAGCEGEPAPEQPPERPGPVRLGELAPSYRTVTLEGDTASLEALRGQVVLLNVWAIRCDPCLKEMPDLKRLHEAYSSEGLVILGLHAGSEGLGKARTFLGLFGIPYPNAAERWDRLEPLMDARRGIPRSALVDRSGRVVRWWSGPISLDTALFAAVLADRHTLLPDGTLRY